MQIRYYVLPDGNQFKVLREGKRRGFHSTQGAAIESALFMGSIEAAKQQTTVELFIEEGGRLVLDRIIGPDDRVGLSATGRPRVIRVGAEEVLA